MQSGWTKGRTEGRRRIGFYAVSIRRRTRLGVSMLLLSALLVLTWRIYVGLEPVAFFQVVEPSRQPVTVSVPGDPISPETAGTATVPGSDDTEAIPTLAGVVVTVEAEPSPRDDRGHPFDRLRLERERQRSREAEAWQRIAWDGHPGEVERGEAARRLESLWSDARKETEIEHLLEASGYRALARIEGGRVHVVVDETLDAKAATRLGELVVEAAGVSREAVTIVDAVSPGG